MEKGNLRPDEVVTRALYGPDFYIEDRHEVRDALRQLTYNGWRIVRLDDVGVVPRTTWAITEEWSP